jgi:gliding motility-associated-like protein
LEFDIIQPDCIKQQFGQITVQQTGGIQPVTYALNGHAYQSSPEFTTVAPGTYTLSIIDDNQCTAAETIQMEAPMDIHVELGNDQVIRYGESVSINATINIPIDSIEHVTWGGLLNPDCPHCLAQFVSPSITTTYTVSVTNHEGCVDRDTIRVVVEEASDVFIPNVFTPNGDGINDRFIITTEAEIEAIESLRIYDRWGTLVYAVQHVAPGDPSTSWDGRKGDEPLNPAVFVYRMILRFSDGRQEIRHGDITLLR